MKFGDYLEEIEYAARQVVGLVWHERDRIDKLKQQAERLSQIVKHDYERAASIQQAAEDADDLVLGVGMYWDTYFGKDKELNSKDKELRRLEEQLISHEFSIWSLSGNLLQYAKQGISIVHGGLGECPGGRLLGTQPLKVVIWRGRNQALHWEDGQFDDPTEQCFQTLAEELDPIFNNYKTQNKAFEVVKLMGWKTFECFRDDLLSLQ